MKEDILPDSLTEFFICLSFHIVQEGNIKQYFSYLRQSLSFFSLSMFPADYKCEIKDFLDYLFVPLMSCACGMNTTLRVRGFRILIYVFDISYSILLL